MVSYPFANVDSYVATFSRIQLYFHPSLLAITDGFHACVALERLVTIIVDVKFNLAKSKTMAKLLIIVISLFTRVSFLHDPIHRYLIDDDEEQRTWCMVHFTPSIGICNSFINIFHSIVPFRLKLISAMSIIGSSAKRRASVKKQNSYMEHIKKQFRKHKHLIISSSCLVTLAMPRLRPVHVTVHLRDRS
ncbi:unnamed protein product [Rotaria magnacalcarata]|nr:unnamed protein product [Rotaria magnacalcarata]